MFIRYPLEYAVFDLETTGVNPGTCEIVEIAAMKVRNGMVVDSYTTLVKFKGPMEDGAFLAHGISKEMTEESGKNAEDAVRELMEFVAGVPLVGHNVYGFDIPLLMRHLNVPDMETFTEVYNDFVDTMVEFRSEHCGLSQNVRRWDWGYLEFCSRMQKQYLKSSLKLACQKFGIDTSDVQLHRAHGDCELVDRLYRKMCLREPSKFSMQAVLTPEELAGFAGEKTELEKLKENEVRSWVANAAMEKAGVVTRENIPDGNVKIEARLTTL